MKFTHPKHSWSDWSTKIPSSYLRPAFRVDVLYWVTLTSYRSPITRPDCFLKFPHCTNSPAIKSNERFIKSVRAKTRDNAEETLRKQLRTSSSDDKKYLGISSRGWFWTQSANGNVDFALFCGNCCKIFEPYSWISKFVLPSSRSRWGRILSCHEDTFSAISLIVSSCKHDADLNRSLGIPRLSTSLYGYCKVLAIFKNQSNNVSIVSERWGGGVTWHQNVWKIRKPTLKCQTETQDAFSTT